ncbi:MAG: hypothetical protein JJU10_03760 [Idiomarina sp.]|nr:hypothetical protein [Idiomarina sp.]
MSLFRRYRRHTWTLIAVAVIGITLTLVAAYLVERNTFRLWQLGSIAEAERMTTELTYRVEREREPLISLATLYKGSEEVTHEELIEAHRQLVDTTSRAAPLTLAWVAGTTDEQRIVHAAGELDWLSTGLDLEIPPELLPTLEDAQEFSPALVIGPLFQRNGTSYLAMAITAPNAGVPGVLVTVTNFDQILREVTAGLIVEGTTLEIYHPRTPGVKFSSLPPLTTAAEAQHDISSPIGQYEWSFR